MKAGIEWVVIIVFIIISALANLFSGKRKEELTSSSWPDLNKRKSARRRPPPVPRQGYSSQRQHAAASWQDSSPEAEVERFLSELRKAAVQSQQLPPQPPVEPAPTPPPVPAPVRAAPKPARDAPVRKKPPAQLAPIVDELGFVIGYGQPMTGEIPEIHLDRRAIRQAIVMKEILDLPRALKPL